MKEKEPIKYNELAYEVDHLPESDVYCECGAKLEYLFTDVRKNRGETIEGYLCEKCNTRVDYIEKQ